MISIDVIQRSVQMLLPDLDGSYRVISFHENTQQVQFLLESNPRRNRAKFTQVSFQAPRIQHKAILLDELKSAREQQKRRDERADGSVPLKLSGKIHKQLESIARSRGVLPKKLLNEMIEQAYHDLVATRQNSQIDSR